MSSYDGNKFNKEDPNKNIVDPKELKNSNKIIKMRFILKPPSSNFYACAQESRSPPAAAPSVVAPPKEDCSAVIIKNNNGSESSRGINGLNGIGLNNFPETGQDDERNQAVKEEVVRSLQELIDLPEKERSNAVWCLFQFLLLNKVEKFPNYVQRLVDLTHSLPVATDQKRALIVLLHQHSGVIFSQLPRKPSQKQTALPVEDSAEDPEEHTHVPGL